MYNDPNEEMISKTSKPQPIQYYLELLEKEIELTYKTYSDLEQTLGVIINQESFAVAGQPMDEKEKFCASPLAQRIRDDADRVKGINNFLFGLINRLNL